MLCGNRDGSLIKVDIKSARVTTPTIVPVFVCLSFSDSLLCKVLSSMSTTIGIILCPFSTIKSYTIPFSQNIINYLKTNPKQNEMVNLEANFQILSP